MRIGRRTFVSSAAAGLIGTTGLGAGGHARSEQTATGRPAAPSDQIVLGFVGVGGMGRANLRDFMRLNDVRVASVCDVWEHNRHLAQRIARDARGGDIEAVADFRRLLDRKDIDAVVVSTPDHWHAIPTIRACEAGKDIYVEKPLAHNVVEGRRMVDAATKHQRVVQMGTQQRSGRHYQEAVQLLHEGKIGKISRVAAWNHINESPAGIGNFPNGAPPAGLDWDTYLGPAPNVPFNPNRFIFNFRWFWDYAGGMMTDWGVHHIDIVHWAMRADAPVTVSATGGKYIVTDNRETPDTLEVVFEYPGFVLTYSHRAGNAYTPNNRAYGIEFYGSAGTMFLDRSGYEIVPETFVQAGDPVPFYEAELKEATTPIEPWDRPRRMRTSRTAFVRGDGSEQHLSHVRNFVDCVKTRSKPRSDIETSHRSTVAALLGNVAFRSGRRIRWDAAAERVDETAASKWLSREPRSPWNT
jgi:predicted dehydrogenase